MRGLLVLFLGLITVWLDPHLRWLMDLLFAGVADCVLDGFAEPVAEGSEDVCHASLHRATSMLGIPWGMERL